MARLKLFGRQSEMRMLRGLTDRIRDGAIETSGQIDLGGNKSTGLPIGFAMARLKR